MQNSTLFLPRFIRYSTLIVLLLTGCCRDCKHSKDKVVKQTYLHEYGVSLSPHEWSARGSSGKVITHKKDGVTVTESYENGKLHGESTETFAYSDILAKSFIYEQGKLTAEKIFSPQGVPLQETRYDTADEKMELTWYEETSTPRSIEQYRRDRLVKGEYFTSSNEIETRVVDGQGIRTIRDHQGKLIYRDTIAAGMLIERITFLPDGSPESVTPYVDGKIHGVRKVFLAEGQPSALESWKKGRKHGPTTLFVNGEKSALIPYVKGVREGVERRFRHGEELAEEISWKNDKRHGPTRFYIDGMIQTEWYYLGDKVSEGLYRSRGFNTAQSTQLDDDAHLSEETFSENNEP